MLLVAEPTRRDLISDALQLDMPEIYLTGKARAREFKYRQMDREMRTAFQKAMQDEWQSFQNFDALRPLTQEESDYVKKQGVVPTKMRWVFTDKKDRLRVSKPSLPLEA